MKKFLLHLTIILVVEAALFFIAYEAFNLGYTTGVTTVMQMIGR